MHEMENSKPVILMQQMPLAMDRIDTSVPASGRIYKSIRDEPEAIADRVDDAALL